MDNEKRNEEWRDVVGYEGLYQVSNLGRVRSCERVEILEWCTRKRQGRIMTIRKGRDGYMHVGLRKPKNPKKYYLVHRLVAEAFIPNPNNLPQVNHRDEDKTNNHVSNLEWMSLLDNVRYGTGIQRRAEKLLNGKLSKRIYQLSLDGSEILNIWQSSHEVQRQLGYTQGAISCCARGDKNTHQCYGFKWQYADDMMRPFRENKSET